jgi:hypothetical protein
MHQVKASMRHHGAKKWRLAQASKRIDMSTTTKQLPTSVPRYYSGEPSQLATHHLMVSQGRGCTEQARICASLNSSAVPMTHLSLSDYPSSAELQRAMLSILREATVGLRIYLLGNEDFIWPLHALARVAGLQPEEIQVIPSASCGHAIYCVHCSTTQHGALDSPHTCTECGVVLEVRQHFSRRLGAYLGVCADARQPYAQARS